MSNYTKEQRQERYEAFYRSTGWCDKDPAADQDAGPTPCGPNIKVIVTRHLIDSAWRKDEFDASWSPDQRFFQDNRRPLDFN